jgi:SAM-dependent methyltransferase
LYSLIKSFAYKKREDWHEARADLFFELMRPKDGAKILDLGGQDGSFMVRVAKRVRAEITVADIGDAPLLAEKHHGFRAVILEEGKPLPFEDREFDVVFCNSVIEHVTVPKEECINRRFPEREWVAASMRSQRAFADELRRVGKGYFVQTPHRAFPVEAHTWLPFVGWMPHDATARLVRFTDKYWVKHCGYVDWHLLGEREMRELLPDARIHVERVLGLPKSLVAYRLADS